MLESLGLGILVLLVKVKDTLDWVGRVGVWFAEGGAHSHGSSQPSASWTWFITIVFIMASRWHREKWSSFLPV